MKLVALVAIAACGGTAPPTPIANKPRHADVTCDEAAVILRGPVSGQDPDAGPAKEAAIKRACVDQRWDPKVLECVGQSIHPASCAEQLTDQQRDDLEAKLDVWQGQYPDRRPTEEDPDDPAADLGVPACDEAAATLAPVLAPQPMVDPDWQRPRRIELIKRSCQDDGWPAATRACATDADPNACVDERAPALRQKLTGVNDLAGKLVTAKQKPAAITCAAVAAAHYADKHTKPKKLSVAEVKASRAELQRVCMADAWDEDTRACIVVTDARTCYAQPMRWSYPALIASGYCDLYKAAADRLGACDKYPAETRTALNDGIATIEQNWANPNLSPDDRKTWDDACRAGFEALSSMLETCDTW